MPLTNFKRAHQELICTACLVLWIAVWYWFNWRDILQKAPYYAIALHCSSEKLREMCGIYDADSADFYRILKLCDRLIPPGKELRLALPAAPLDKHQFLREKGRYYLYPRNYGDNEGPADYILVFGAEGFQEPRDYEKRIVFSKDKYLLVKSGCFLNRIEDADDR